MTMMFDSTHWTMYYTVVYMLYCYAVILLCICVMLVVYNGGVFGFLAGLKPHSPLEDRCVPKQGRFGLKRGDVRL